MRKKNWKLAALLLPFILGISACHDGFNCVEGNGDVILENRDHYDFYEIVSEGDFDIFLVQDSIYRVEIEAESNLMPYIRTRMIGDRLEIDTRNNRCIDESYPVRVFIRAPFVESTILEGSGHINIDYYVVPAFNIDLVGSGNIEAEVVTDYLSVDIVGSGNAEVWGNAVESEMNISGSGNIRAYDLIQENCFATISGSGSMYLFATDLLDVKISGSGSVYYKGNPDVYTNITGSGSVVKVN